MSISQGYRLFLKLGEERIDITDEVKTPIYSFGFVKPHAFEKRDEILDYIERFSASRGTPLYVLQAKEEQLTVTEAEEHYHEHREKPFFRDLVSMATEGPAYHFIVNSGDIEINATQGGAIQIFRYVVGNTDPKKAQRGSVRYVFGDKTRSIMYNAVHASDGLESFIREIEIHFSRDELGVEFWARLDAYKQWLEHFRDRS